MIGRANKVIMITEAPMIPVVAASIVPIKVTASASPPGTRRMITCRQFNRSRAIPDLSSIVPMNTNMGMAVRMRFSMMPPKIREGSVRNWMNRNSSVTIPMSPKASPTPPSTQATGNPENNRIASTMNMNRGRSSTRLICCPRQRSDAPCLREALP